MAPALTSNSFFLTTPPRWSRLTVSAKGARPFPSFKFGKPTTTDGPADEPGKPNGFFFDFGKVSDIRSLIPVVPNPSAGLSRRKDAGTVFVAGATGQAGIRIAQTLLREGFSVRAGVPELAAAQEIALLASQYKVISKEESRRLNAVESTFQDAESIAKAIGNASKVVVTIGPEENGPTKEVTASDAFQVIQAAQLAGVGHVAIVYDDTSASGSTYNVLDGFTSFFNNFFSQTQPLTIVELLQKVVETDVSYTLIKTKLTEDFSPESSYNLVVSAEGSISQNDYKVAKSQIASLVADVFANTSVAENKVVEVSTDPSAPSKPINGLFSAIPEDGRRKAYAEALAKAKIEEEETKASEKAREAALAAKKLEESLKNRSEQASLAEEAQEKAQEKAEAAGVSVEELVNRAKGIGAGFSWEKLSSQLATAVPKSASAEKLKVQIATVRGEAKARKLQPQKAVFKQPNLNPFGFKPKEEPKPKKTQTEPNKEVRKVFGGLFKQETIYMDED